VPVGRLFAVDQHGQPLLRQWVRLSQGKDDEDAPGIRAIRSFTRTPETFGFSVNTSNN